MWHWRVRWKHEDCMLTLWMVFYWPSRPDIRRRLEYCRIRDWPRVWVASFKNKNRNNCCGCRVVFFGSGGGKKMVRNPCQFMWARIELRKCIVICCVCVVANNVWDAVVLSPLRIVICDETSLRVLFLKLFFWGCYCRVNLAEILSKGFSKTKLICNYQSFKKK